MSHLSNFTDETVNYQCIALHAKILRLITKSQESKATYRPDCKIRCCNYVRKYKYTTQIFRSSYPYNAPFQFFALYVWSFFLDGKIWHSTSHFWVYINLLNNFLFSQSKCTEILIRVRYPVAVEASASLNKSLKQFRDFIFFKYFYHLIQSSKIFICEYIARETNFLQYCTETDLIGAKSTVRFIQPTLLSQD